MPLREESGAMIGAGLSMIAQSLPYSKEHRDDLSTFGQQMGQLLTNRFQAQQFDDFVNNEYTQFQNQQAQIHQQMGAIPAEEFDKVPQMLSEWNYSTLMPFITKNSMKYANNPRIVEGLQKTLEAHTKAFEQFDKAAQTGTQARQVDAQIENEGKKTDAYVSLTGQQIEESKSAEAANQATARYKNAQAANLGKTKFALGDDLATTMAKAQMLDPKVTGGKDGLDARTNRSLVSAYIAAHKTEIRPDGRRYGEPTEEGTRTEDEMVLKILEADPTQHQKDLIKGRIMQAHPAGPNALKDPAFNGYFDDEDSPKNRIATVRGAVPPKTLIGALTATPENELPPEAADVDGYIENIVRTADDPAQLGGFFQSILLEGGLRANQHQQVLNSEGKVITFAGYKSSLDSDDRQITDKELAANKTKLYHALMAEYATQVGPLISPDAMSQRARFDAQKIAKEVILHFLPSVADRLGVPIPKAREKPSYRDYLKQAIGDFPVYYPEAKPGIFRDKGGGPENPHKFRLYD